MTAYQSVKHYLDDGMTQRIYRLSHSLLTRLTLHGLNFTRPMFENIKIIWNLSQLSMGVSNMNFNITVQEITWQKLTRFAWYGKAHMQCEVAKLLSCMPNVTDIELINMDDDKRGLTREGSEMLLSQITAYRGQLTRLDVDDYLDDDAMTQLIHRLPHFTQLTQLVLDSETVLKNI